MANTAADQPALKAGPDMPHSEVYVASELRCSVTGEISLTI